MNGERYSDLSVTAWKRCRGVREQKHLQSSVKDLPTGKAKCQAQEAWGSNGASSCWLRRAGGARLFPIQWRHIDSLKTVMAGIFTPAELANPTDQWARCETLTSRPLHIGVHRKAHRTTRKDFLFWKMSNTIKEICILWFYCVISCYSVRWIEGI